MTKTLLIEDDIETHHLLKRILSKHGYAVTSSFDAKSALDLYQKGQYPFIVSDVGLPGMDGLELWRQIR